ncbi:MAG: sulfite exporter TauE/SafE family protein [Rhodobacteraceae bacterium]|nr:sulfite exporter TauE/SafE family protein [Paracoccaceae bacterium]
MEPTTALFLIVIGLVGGAWNAVAGGATLFTFPALMAVGLPPVVANATNYLAMLPSNAAAIPAYRRELRDVGRRCWPLLIVSGAGAILGSLLLLVSEAALFEFLVPFLILIATGLFALGPKLANSLRAVFSGEAPMVLLYAALFTFSIYGGYFGAGLGIILLAIVQIMGFTSFHIANSLKNLLATSFTVLSILVFGVGGIIAWPEALVMMTGSSVGGYLGGRYAKCINETYLRTGVTLFGLLLSAVYTVRLAQQG